MSVATADKLQGEIEQGRKLVRTDRYSMSIGELVSLYRDDELIIEPEFQRLFRWDDRQKSRFVESVLLGLPIPPIFVSQRADGVWELVDGLQRVSTLLQLMGELRSYEPLRLGATEYLPTLDGKVWRDDARPETTLSDAQKLDIRRARLEVEIIREGDNPEVKYEVFDRLNSGGSALTEQEVRDCIVVRLSPTLYRWLRERASDEDFRTCVALAPTEENRAYDTELVLRFAVLRVLDDAQLRRIGDIHEFLDREVRRIARDPGFDFQGESGAFRATFAALSRELEEDSFRQYAIGKGRHTGRFLISAYEAIGIGLGYHMGSGGTGAPADLVARVRSLWGNEDFRKHSGSGVRASQRIPKVIPIGRALFAQ